MKLCRNLALALSLGFCIWTVPCQGQVKTLPPAPAQAEMIPTTLNDYLAIPDPSFAWKLNGKSEHVLGQIYDVELTTQTWMDMPWKHVMMIYEPKTLANPNHVLLFITGGSHLNKPKAEEQQLGLMLANLAGGRVAMLHQVPNQPLLGGRHEDDLITDTILFYLATGDKRWPLLFPMVKSAVKAMDAVEQIAEQEWKSPVAGFVVTGASKRGWTTWLSGASDKRILGIAPIVIDTMNFQKQMDYQLETWGKYSEQIDDYTRKGLIKRMSDDKTEPVWKWVDPFTYRNKLTLPKLIINGTNDRYWTVDALNNYWDDLEGEKYIRYVPNAGHNLKGGREAALATLAAFFQNVVQAKPMPKLTWKHSTQDGKLRLAMTSNVKPNAVRLWVAKSPTKDFREAQWLATDLTGDNSEDNAFLGEVEQPKTGHIALYGELLFQKALLEYSLTTQLKRE